MDRVTDYPTAVTVAAPKLHDALRFQTVLTIETVKAALYQHVYRVWESRGTFGCHCDDDAIPTLHVSDSARVVYLDGSKR